MRVFTVISVVFILLFTTLAATAQTSGVCPGVVDQALAQLGTNCADLNRNSACYGFNNVEAEFTVPVPDGFFTTTNERAELLTIDSIQSGPLDLANDDYGVSLLSVQANLPGTLPGQGVVFVLIGGSKVKNGVAPDDTVIPTTSVQITTTTDTDLRTYPNGDGFPSSEVIGIVATGSSLTADAIDPTGTFVRVVANDKPGWIDSAATSGDVSSLTVVGPDSKTPMQAFFFRTGIGGVSCDDVPSVLAVQGPHNAAVDINADGVDVRIGSTVVLQTLPPGANPPTTLQLTALYGLVTIYPGTPNAIIVPPGFTITIALSPVGADGFSQTAIGDWSPIRPMTQEEIDTLERLELIPANVLNYSIEVPNLIRASGIGSTVPEFFFTDQNTLDAARVACANGQLPVAVCDVLGL